MYAALCQEPWCLTPDEVSRLTDWQVEHLYVRPAAERAERFRREHQMGNGTPPTPMDAAPDPDPDRDRPTRAEYVGTATSFLGWSREKADAEFDRQWPGGS